MLFRGFLAIIPILIGVLVATRSLSQWELSIPRRLLMLTVCAANSLYAALRVVCHSDYLPAALVVIAEHVGHLVVTANSSKKICCAIQVCTVRCLLTAVDRDLRLLWFHAKYHLRGKLGVMAITRVYSTWVIGGAAISLSCFPASVNWLLLSR